MVEQKLIPFPLRVSQSALLLVLVNTLGLAKTYILTGTLRAYAIKTRGLRQTIQQ